MATKKRGLGRGLDALLGSKPSEKKIDKSQLIELNVELMQPGKYQPRKQMDMMKLRELADSIKAQGMVQPIVVRKIKGNKYEIIAGERRWRAAQIAELKKAPVVIKDVSDKQTIAMALIENIQREDLNPLEEAMALDRLIEEFDLTHQQAADSVGRSRVAVSNLLRLLELHKDVKKLLAEGDLEMGHSRALLALEKKNQLAVAREVIKKGLSVRATESLVKNFNNESKGSKAENHVDKDIQRLEEELSEKICSNVKIQHKKNGKGKLVINYFSVDELEGILNRIK